MKSRKPLPGVRFSSLFALAAFLLIPSASAVTLFSETFDTPAVDTTAFDAAYPAFTTTVDVGREVTAAGGQAVITTSAEGNNLGQATVSGFAGEVTYSVDVGASNSGGSYNVGMLIGGNRVVFHPGFNPIPGAFRVEGDGGFGNQDMGFVPANGVLHHLEVKQNPGGLFEITFTDGANALNVYTNSWTNAAAVGQPFGIIRNGPSAGQTGFFDNLMATQIPEPSSGLLLGFGALALVAGRRRR